MKMKDRILLVEDEDTLATIISETLADEGFDIATARNGVDGLDRFRRNGADLVIADVMMPRMDGFEMARHIRSIDADVPLIFLTARSSIDDIVEGFDIGANDYLKKPFKMRELIVRMRALLRRRSRAVSPIGKRVDIGRYSFDSVANTLSFDDNTVALTHIESRLLGYLSAHVGETVTSSELMEHIWNHDDYYNRNSLHGFIHKLRRHLRHDPDITLINLRGIGYRLVIHPTEKRGGAPCGAHGD